MKQALVRRVHFNAALIERDLRMVSVSAAGVFAHFLVCTAGRDDALMDVEVGFFTSLPARRVDVLLAELCDAGLIELAEREPAEPVPGEENRPALPHFRIATRYFSAREMRPDGATWRWLREAVFERDGRACVYCGAADRLHCDHVVPIARGGTSDIENLTTACGDCNKSKGARTPAQWRPPHG